MERSVTESPLDPAHDALALGRPWVLVGIAIFTLVVLGFDWLMAASP